MDFDCLADALIANASRGGSIGQIYRLLCRYHDDDIARREFVRFLQGERSELLLHAVKNEIAARVQDSS